MVCGRRESLTDRAAGLDPCVLAPVIAVEERAKGSVSMSTALSPEMSHKLDASPPHAPLAAPASGKAAYTCPMHPRGRHQPIGQDPRTGDVHPPA